MQINTKTVEALSGITDFGYDSPEQFYIELCEHCTVVLNYDNDEGAITSIYKNGSLIDRKTLSSSQLNLVDDIISEFKIKC